MKLPTRSATGSEIQPETGLLREVVAFGPNPGRLRLHVALPSKRSRLCPALVVLHGCSQHAAGFHAASDLGALAAANGFALIYPEQSRSNNDQTCFSWFRADDTTRDEGEVASIASMVRFGIETYALDPASIFVCGFSAGGAMAAACLACYPELFHGGAVIGGLPFGAAQSVSAALDAMYVGRIKEASRWGDLVRAAAPPRTVWPRIAVWHGTADTVVKPINAGELVKQWTNVHDVGAVSPDVDQVGPAMRRIWRDEHGCECVSEYVLPGFGHAVPLGGDAVPAPFFAPAGIDALEQIADDFGLLHRQAAKRGLSSLLGLWS